MNSIGLEITLLTDVVLTARSATVGGPGSLDHIPGSVLLGAAAARLYPHQPPDVAFALFHSGAVRFGDGLPIAPGGTLGLPAPLSFHTVKGVEAGKRGQPVAWINRARRTSDGPFVQVRDQRMAGSIFWAPERTVSMRTAIGEGGRAREGLLYGYEALQAGMVFRARVDADDAERLEQVRLALVGDVRIGRSRSAEFGLVKIVDAPVDAHRSLEQPAEAGRVVVLCLSDLCLRDPGTGQPTLDPMPSAFGLPDGWRLDVPRSFVRHRRWSPFNTHRRRPDLERQAIVAGSVLVFAGDGAPGLEALRRRCAAGIGEYREQGLGQVLIEPKVLQETELWMTKGFKAEATDGEWAAITADPLLGWLTARDRARTARDACWHTAKDWAREFAWARIPRSQWGEVRSLSRQAQARHDATWLRAELGRRILAPPSRYDAPATEAARRTALRSWGRKGRDGKTAAEAFLKRMDDTPARDLPILCELIATHAVRLSEGDPHE